jgi:hypothetical protein
LELVGNELKSIWSFFFFHGQGIGTSGRDWQGPYTLGLAITH